MLPSGTFERPGKQPRGQTLSWKLVSCPVPVQKSSGYNTSRHLDRLVLTISAHHDLLQEKTYNNSWPRKNELYKFNEIPWVSSPISWWNKLNSSIFGRNCSSTTPVSTSEPVGFSTTGTVRLARRCLQNTCGAQAQQSLNGRLVEACVAWCDGCWVVTVMKVRGRGWWAGDAMKVMRWCWWFMRYKDQSHAEATSKNEQKWLYWYLSTKKTLWTISFLTARNWSIAIRG